MTSIAPASLPDFDTLTRLARDDPQAFESLRHDMVEDFIEHAPANRQARLRGLQFRVDAVRKLAKSDLGAAVKIYEMMWHSFRQLANEWDNLRLPPDPRPAGSNAAPHDAKVLRLPLHHH